MIDYNLKSLFGMHFKFTNSRIHECKKYVMVCYRYFSHTNLCLKKLLHLAFHRLVLPHVFLVVMEVSLDKRGMQMELEGGDGGHSVNSQDTSSMGAGGRVNIQWGLEGGSMEMEDNRSTRKKRHRLGYAVGYTAGGRVHECKRFSVRCWKFQRRSVEVG